MNAAAGLLGLLSRAGIAVERHGDRLTLIGVREDVAQVTAACRALKPDLLALLPDLDRPTCADCGTADASVYLVVSGNDGETRLCATCWRR